MKHLHLNVYVQLHTMWRLNVTCTTGNKLSSTVSIIFAADSFLQMLPFVWALSRGSALCPVRWSASSLRLTFQRIFHWSQNVQHSGEAQPSRTGYEYMEEQHLYGLLYRRLKTVNDWDGVFFLFIPWEWLSPSIKSLAAGGCSRAAACPTCPNEEQTVRQTARQ